MPSDTKRTPRTSLPRLTDRLPLRGGLRVSPFCLGAVADPATVSEAFDRGINFFFITADMHWPFYESTRRGLIDLLARKPGVRDDIVVAVVAYVTQPEFFHVPFREVLEVVPGLGRVDVTVAGGSYRSDFAVRAAQFPAHDRVGARAFGTSFHDRDMGAEALRDKRIDVGFVRYNSEHRGAEEDLFPHLSSGDATERPLLYNFTSTRGFLPAERYAALGLTDAHWHPTVTDHYRFVLRRSEIDGLLCAPKIPAEVAALDEALGRGPLTDEEDEYIRDLSDLALGKASLNAPS